MDTLLVSSRLFLALVFAVAGIVKLLDLAGSRRAVGEFGLPTPWANVLGLLLPLTELVIAIALIFILTAWWGALGALILLLLFIGGISLNLAHGRRPDCHCFGALHSTPVGWTTLIRNGILLAMAGFIVWQGPRKVGPSVVNWLFALTTVEIVGLIAMVIILSLLTIEGWFLFHLLRQNGRLLLRIETLEKRLDGVDTPFASGQAMPTSGLPIGTQAPTFQLSGLYGKTFTLDALRSKGKPLMLIFSDPGCGPCNALMPEIAEWQHDYVSKLTIALISRGTVEANRVKSGEHALTHVLLQRDREVAEAYRANGTPSAVMVRPDGTIGSVLAAGAVAIRNLIAQTMNMPNPIQPTVALPVATGDCGCGNGKGHALTPTLPTVVKIGERAPELKLPNLDGQIVELANFQGNNTLVLFWNPGCGFCNKMLNDLKAWEFNSPKGTPQLLVVSTGTVEENRAMGLRSPIVLDQGFSTGYAFGANGTPSAVLVDAQGNIASEIAVGASAVLALAQVTKADP
ncbi:MAG: hypothetical protein Fur0044_07550 [Anaerolineae bacterium]